MMVNKIIKLLMAIVMINWTPDNNLWPISIGDNGWVCGFKTSVSCLKSLKLFEYKMAP